MRARLRSLYPLAVLGDQFCRQCRQNLFAVLGPLLLQHVRADSGADAPVEQHEGRVDGPGGGLAGLLDQGTKIRQQVGRHRDGGRRRRDQIGGRGFLLLAHLATSSGTRTPRSALLPTALVALRVAGYVSIVPAVAF
jgi:hypothetical protein